jgi:hypothetical protein
MDFGLLGKGMEIMRARERLVSTAAKEAAAKGQFAMKYSKIRPSGAKAQPLFCCNCDTTEQLGENVLICRQFHKKQTSGLEGRVDYARFMSGINPRPTA